MALGVNIVSEFNASGVNKAIKDFKRLDNSIDKTVFTMKTMDSAITNGVKKLAKIGAIAGVAGGIIGKSLVGAASDLEESISKVNVVFGQSADEINAFAKTAATSMGISRQQALEATGTYGNLLQAFGTTREEAAKMSMTMVQLAGDLASFNNASIEDTLLAIRSGLSGESEPLKRFGIAINDARLKQEALNMGLYNGKGNLDIFAKTQAAYALILKDSTLAQGDYLRTSDGVANQQRTLQATFEDVKAELGNALLPTYKTILQFINEKVIPVFRNFAAILGEEGLGAALKYLGGESLNAIGKLDGWGAAIYGIVAAVLALKAATVAFTIAQGLATVAVTAFGVAWNATGIGLIVSLIAAVIVAIIAMAVKFQWFRNILKDIWNAIVVAFQGAIDAMLAYAEFFVNMFIKGVNLIIKGWNLIPFHKDIQPLKEMNFELDIMALKIDKVNNKVKQTKFVPTSAADFRKREGWGGGTKTTMPPPPGGGGGGDGLDAAAEAVKKLNERLKKYADLVKSTSDLQKDLTAAVKRTTEANSKLAEANKKLASAQETFQKVAKGYGAGSKEAANATDALSQAQRDQTRAGFDLERSKFAVLDAEKALADARKEGDPQAIRQAEFDLAEAQMTVIEKEIALKDAVKATEEAQRQLNGTIAGFNENSTEYQDALTTLKDAQIELRDATEDVNDAKLKELETTNKLIAANKQLSALEKAGITKKQAKRVARSLKKAGVTITPDMWDTLGITPFAKGGIVTSPVNALIGEAGPEAVIPLDRLDSPTPSKIEINITAGVGDPVEIGRKVVDALKAYERRVGALPIKVSN